jgi:glycosyltransferase involved in cell wall biosynthesis
MDNPPNIMHWTYPVPVELAGARNIYTLHDLVPLKLPYTTLDSKAFYRGIAKRCVEGSAHVCTVSEASRADILAEFDADPAHVTNTYQAAPAPTNRPATDTVEDAAIIGRAFGLTHRGYFLFFGAIEPKKNLGRLIEAYLSIQSDLPLVIVGGRAWQSEGELQLLGPDASAGGPPGLSAAPLVAASDSVGARGRLPVALRGFRLAGAGGDAARHAGSDRQHRIPA